METKQLAFDFVTHNQTEVITDPLQEVIEDKLPVPDRPKEEPYVFYIPMDCR
jgi:hypothetical protein